jgi:crossover junction endodeoxyribonuclease RuvC
MGAMASPSPVPRLVLGLDPGTRVVGWGLVERRGGRLVAVAHGALRPDPKRPVAERLAAIAAGLREVLSRHRPTEAAVEEAFYGRDARAAQRIGEGRGALLVVLAEAGLSVTSYPNNVVKKAVTGQGRATKEQMRAMIRRILALETAPETHDAADALAMAVCHHQRPDLPGSAGLPPRVAKAVERARRSR